MTSTLRHPQSRNARRGAVRGASRPVKREPLLTRIATPVKKGLRKVAPVVLGVLSLFAAYQGFQAAQPYIDQPIGQVNVKGSLSYTDPILVKDRIAEHVETTFFKVDLVGLQQSLEAIPWIAHAEVRRVWPNEVTIHLEEQLPIARWGETALLSSRGNTFSPDELSKYEHLPHLSGPNRAQQQVMQQYQLLSQMLRPYDLGVSKLELRERGSWFLTTSNGLELLLGRDQVVDKMRRFIAVYQQTLKLHSDTIARIDLRYPNGLAVAWRETTDAAAPSVAATN